MTTIVTRANVSEVATKDLVAFYNAHNVDKPVAKFADRKTAERRVLSIMDSLDIIAQQGGDVEDGKLVEGAPVHKTRASRAVKPDTFVSPNADVPDEELTDEQIRQELEALKNHKEETKAKVGAKSGLTLSAAIAKSWTDPVIADKRMQRNGVTVTCNGSSDEFKSVRAAFATLGLPDAKHIRFRMKVKEAGKAIFEHNGQSYLFELTEETGE